MEIRQGCRLRESVDAAGAAAAVTISLSGDSLKISATCSVHLRKRTYYAGGPFQALLKSGEREAGIAKFMQRSLNFDLKGAKDYFELDDVDCNKLGSDMLVSANQLIVIRGSDFFYAFDRQGGKPEATAATGASGEASLKVTSLPFSMADYAANCYPAMVKGAVAIQQVRATLLLPRGLAQQHRSGEQAGGSA